MKPIANDFIRRMTSSMRHYDFGCIEARGGHTCYQSDLSLNLNESPCVPHVSHQVERLSCVPLITLVNFDVTIGCYMIVILVFNTILSVVVKRIANDFIRRLTRKIVLTHRRCQSSDEVICDTFHDRKCI